MSQSVNLSLAQEFLGRLGDGKAEEVAELFTEDLVWEVPGDDGVLPWIGKSSGRGAVVDFINNSRAMIERIVLTVDDLIASENRAVVLGHLVSKHKPTGRVIDTYFALVLTIANGKINRFQMIEDSFAVSKALRG